MTNIDTAITELMNRLDSMVDNGDSEQLLVISKSITLLKQSMELELTKPALYPYIQSFSQTQSIPYSEFSKLSNNVFLKVGYLATVVTNPTDYLLLVKSLVDITQYSAAYVYVTEPQENQSSLIKAIGDKYKQRLTDVLQSMQSRIGTIDNSEDATLSTQSISDALALSVDSGNYKRIINLIKELDKKISVCSAKMLSGDSVLTKEIDTRCDSIQSQITALKDSDNPFGITKEKINLANVDNFGNTSDVTVNSESLYATAKGVNSVWEKAKDAVADVPEDGKYYVRKDKAWVEGLDIMPIGAIMAYSGASPPIGWLVIEAKTVHTKVMYPALYEHLKTHCPHLIIDDNTFRLVDSQGMFLRGLDKEGTVDPEGVGRDILSAQEDAIRNITGKMLMINYTGASCTSNSGCFYGNNKIKKSNNHNLTFNRNNAYDYYIENLFDASRVVPTSSENRPKNLNVLWIIKAYHSVSNPELLQAENIINKINENNKEIQTLKTKMGGRKNLIINGDFRVHQRGSEATWDMTDEVNFPKKEFGVADRFRTHSLAIGTATVVRKKQYIDTVYNKKWLTTVMEVPLNSEDYQNRSIVYFFEKKDIDFLGGGTVSLSFLFRASKLGQYSLSFGLGDDETFTIFSWDYTGGIKKCSFTFILPNDLLEHPSRIDYGLSIYFNYMVGDEMTKNISDDSNLNGVFKNTADSSAGLMRTSDVRWDKEAGNWVSYSEVQLELGDTATEFERLTYAEQLAMCQRYYEYIGTVHVSPWHAYSASKYRHVDVSMVPKRAFPTIRYQNGIDNPPTVNVVSCNNNTFARFYISGDSRTDGGFSLGNVTADAEI